jgi:kumamolisin
VAPLWAGLIALLNEKLQTRTGLINPMLYDADESTCFRDITAGNNGAYSAGSGWDAATGLGTPVGVSLVQAIQESTSQTQTRRGTRSSSSQ